LGQDAATQTATGQMATGHTATGKPHFDVLDGLRGTAAMLVVVFHIQGITVAWEGARIVLHHAILAVDFFFMLSGFVIGYAYDDRWPQMSARQFFALRLVRLHPMVILGTLLGFASYVLDPFAGTAQAVPWRDLLVALACGLLLLPGPMLPNRWGDTHPFNGPCWSLLQEYIGNIAYAFALRHLPARALGLLALGSGAVLVGCTAMLDSIDQGSAWPSLWMAPVRLCFPFVTGLWLYRVRDRLPRFKLGWGPLSLALVVVSAAPTFRPVAGIPLNGLYEALCVIVAFPLIVHAGAHSGAHRGAGAGWTDWLCRASGRISYPLYLTHFPFLYVWMNYVATVRPAPLRMAVIGMALVPLLVLVAWVALRAWDEPIRRALRVTLKTAGDKP